LARQTAAAQNPNALECALPNRLLWAAVGFASSSVAWASSPISLSYTVTPSQDGRYRYRFTLELTNEDSSWQPGQGFGWFVFADGAGAPSPLGDFEGDPSSLVRGPWDRFEGTAGFNNGPSLGRVRGVWVPNDVGASITWEGTSTSRVADGELRWSSLVTEGRSGPIESEPAHPQTHCGPADINRDGRLDGNDFDLFTAMYNLGDIAADLDRSGFVGPDDWEIFVIDFTAGC